MRNNCLILTAAAILMATAAQPAQATETLCDPADENCRTILINYIRNERVSIDVAFWFMEDPRYTTELISRFRAGVPVRVLVDTRANSSYPANAYRLEELRAAGIPMRRRVASGILHWKMMLFGGQDVVQFSGANYSDNAFVYAGSPYSNYIDEAIYFTDTPGVVGSFKTKFDDLWTNTSSYANYANISGSLTRRHATYSKDPELNFPPNESYRNRAVGHYNAESVGIDVIMYRITDRAHTDAIIAARQRGVPVRLYHEQQEYRNPARLWHAWNVDRLHMAGVSIKNRAHAGLNHQKSVILHGQRMVIFGSSNWTSPSTNSQEEHNYFTRRSNLYTWFVDQFNRKWNNLAPYDETAAFTPLPPDVASKPSPSSGATGIGSSVTLKWYGGPWAHVYDIYLGTSTSPPLFAQNLELGPSASTSQMQQLVVSNLAPGTTYYWRVVSKTMANRTATSSLWMFTTSGSGGGTPTPSGGDIVLYASSASTRVGAWQIVSDSSAAGASCMHLPDVGAAKIASAAASPANYLELTFNAEAGRAYRLWIRGKAQNNYWGNDSVFVQFSGSVTSSGSAQWRIGTTSATEWNLEDCSGCGISGWGWQDNGWGTGVMGPLVYFASTGTQRIRIQQREDGVSIDQIVLSPATYLNSSPGALKNDSTILPRTN
jgi:phosphatidylserine/phosphatidylglycerophosphate/cardiolipin synthase-like enzyme